MGGKIYLKIMENIISLFISQAQSNPQGIAIIEGKTKITFQELLHEVKLKVAYFKQKGIVAGDRVLVFVPISLDLYKTVLAIFYLGAVAVFIDEWVSFKRLSICCKIADCKAFVAPFKLRLLSYLSSDLRKIPIKLNTSSKAINCNFEPYLAKKSETALITFTTGSTGIPKAADRTNEFLHYQFLALKPLIQAKQGEVDLTMLPIVLLLNLGLGKTSVIPAFNSRKPNKFNPSVLVNQILENKVEVLTSSPYFVIQLADYVLKNNIKLPTLQKIFTGGAPVFPYEAQKVIEAFPNVDSKVVFGSTEAEPISHLDMRQLASQNTAYLQGLNVGKIDSNTQVLILPIQDKPYGDISENDLNSMHLVNGKVGEICVSGNHVLKSYIKNPEAILQNKIITEQNTWHRTGDAGFISDENQLYLVGRCKQIIEWESKVYYPFLVEDFCRKQTGVELGTLILKNNIPVLVLEVNKNFQMQNFKSLAEIHALSFEIKLINKMPRDPRHFSKIDYSLLTSQISKL